MDSDLLIEVVVNSEWVFSLQMFYIHGASAMYYEWIRRKPMLVNGLLRFNPFENPIL